MKFVKLFLISAIVLVGSCSNIIIDQNDYELQEIGIPLTEEEKVLYSEDQTSNDYQYLNEDIAGEKAFWGYPFNGRIVNNSKYSVRINGSTKNDGKKNYNYTLPSYSKTSNSYDIDFVKCNANNKWYKVGANVIVILNNSKFRYQVLFRYATNSEIKQFSLK